MKYSLSAPSKYFLFIGYQTFEKYQHFGKIQVYLNDTLLEEFDASNEESTSVSHILKTGKRKNPVRPQFDIGFKIQYPNSLDTEYEYNFQSPKKFKVIDLAETNFQYKKVNNLTIKVKGGPSNYTNGFVTKKNMIMLFPIFMIPETMFIDTKLIDKLFERNKKFFYAMAKNKIRDWTTTEFPFYDYRDFHIDLSGTNAGSTPLRCKQFQWPGPNVAENSNKPNSYFVLGNAHGGNFDLKFYIHKKYNYYSLQALQDPPKGYMQLNMIFPCLFKKFTKLVSFFNK